MKQFATLLSRPHSLWLLACFFLAGSSVSLRGSSDTPAPTTTEELNESWTFSLYWENDIFAGTDAYYTNGVKLSWISPDLTRYRDARILPPWAYAMTEYLPFIHEPGIQRNVALAIGQSIFTPADITTGAFQPVDRPYAGWLYTSLALHNKTEHFLDTLEISLGVVGPWSLAEHAQKWVHEVKDVQRPNGWRHQLKNEPAVNFVWERKYRLFKTGGERGPGLDATGHVGAALGNVYTYANAGGYLRAGWNLPIDFGPSAIRLAGDTNAPASTRDPRFAEDASWGFHLFAGVDGRLMARDIFLDGNSWRDSHSVDKEPLVADFQAGASLLLSRWKLTYNHVLRTRQFEQQRNSHHDFGSITLSYSY